LSAGSEILLQIDESGRLLLTPELIARYGLQPGTQVCLDELRNGLYIRRPVTQLARVYIEPTSLCNLNCRMCARNVFAEPQGHMQTVIFDRIIAGVRELPDPPEIFFGGFGEPLSHPGIIEMVAQAKAVARSVELITNGTLLTQELSHQLIEAGLDVLWVSLDGVTPESYTDVRLGAELPGILENIEHFHKSRLAGDWFKPEIGIAFVAMKRNIAELPRLLRWSTRLGASRFIVTNVLPYTEDMCAEVLYPHVLQQITCKPSMWVPTLDLPKIDLSEITREPLYRVLRGGQNLNLNGDIFGGAKYRCSFILRGSTASGWDGGMSPCLPLMHSYTSFLEPQRMRFSRRYVAGNLAEHSLKELWDSPNYVAFRRRVQQFDFSPCTMCGGCDLSEANEEDCFGNTFPTCGGCLWAQGVIQCP
jgi:MoaA/NifB/PqqE/SkfB family radical SAM enzyme